MVSSGMNGVKALGDRNTAAVEVDFVCVGQQSSENDDEDEKVSDTYLSFMVNSAISPSSRIREANEADKVTKPKSSDD